MPEQQDIFCNSVSAIIVLFEHGVLVVWISKTPPYMYLNVSTCNLHKWHERHPRGPLIELLCLKDSLTEFPLAALHVEGVFFVGLVDLTSCNVLSADFAFAELWMVEVASLTIGCSYFWLGSWRMSFRFRLHLHPRLYRFPVLCVSIRQERGPTLSTHELFSDGALGVYSLKGILVLLLELLAMVLRARHKFPVAWTRCHLTLWDTPSASYGLTNASTVGMVVLFLLDIRFWAGLLACFAIPERPFVHLSYVA